MNRNIFRAYDIRGIFGIDFQPTDLALAKQTGGSGTLLQVLEILLYLEKERWCSETQTS